MDYSPYHLVSAHHLVCHLKTSDHHHLVLDHHHHPQALQALLLQDLDLAW